MLVMPATNKDFQGMAKAIADEFFTKGVSLEDGIVQAAVAHELTPEEVKRLVEKTNTTASIQMLRTAEDKKSTFDLATTKSVLQRTHPRGEEETQEEAPAQYQGLPQTRDEADEKMLEQEEKTASAASAAPQVQVGIPKLATKLFKARRMLEEAKREKFASEMKIRDNLDHIISEFSVSQHTFFHKFASDQHTFFHKLAADAMALYGTTAETVLRHVADYLGESMPQEKTAGIIDDRQPMLAVMGDTCTRIEKLALQEAEIAELAQAVEAYNRTALGHGHDN